uniref:MBL fold metallo-hydrolase n=1 Tax=Heterorhabditis bacteriophora TaxID=37862 RepID=A0A1I7XIM6_HETBA
MKVIPVRALEDNYMYIVYNEHDLRGLVVDPVEPKKMKKITDDMGVCNSQISIAVSMIIVRTAEQMHHNLSILANLPDHTCVYPGHEYTYNNLQFAHYIEPENEAKNNFKGL